MHRDARGVEAAGETGAWAHFGLVADVRTDIGASGFGWVLAWIHRPVRPLSG